ncbi:MAG: hypothetical protein MK077_01890 [Phycisphaerales bacterium]|nr:hypothetical protein [Phycisphaerales bacterium]
MAIKTHLSASRLGGIVALVLVSFGVWWWLPSRTPGPPAVRPEVGVLTDPLLAPQLAGLADAVDARSWDHESRAVLGMTYEANELYGPAQKTWQQLHQLDAGNWIWLYRLAMTTERLGDLETAVGLMRAAAQAAPATQPDPWWRLALWSTDMGDLVTAEAALSKAQAVDAQALPVRLAEVRLQLAAGNGADAEALIKQHGLFNELSSGYVWHLKADALRRQGRIEEARSAMNQGDSRRPPLADGFSAQMGSAIGGLRAIKQAAASQAAAGQWGDVLRLAKQVLQYEPDDIVHQRLYALALLRTGDPVAAEEALESLFSVTQDPMTCSALASARLALYQEQKNQAHLHAALEAAFAGLAAHPDHRPLLMACGRAEAMLGRYHDAFDTFRAAWDLNRAHPTTLELAVRAAHQADVWEDAREMSRALYQANPSHPLAGPGYALGLIRFGDYETAMQILDEVDPRRVNPSLLSKARREYATYDTP